MKVFFPKTNPIYFLQEGEYREWQDARKFESVCEYVQEYSDFDLLSFQFSVKKDSPFQTCSVSIFLETITGTRTNIFSGSISQVDAGTYPDAFVKNLSSLRSVVGFSKKFEDFTTIEKGKCFRIVVELRMNAITHTYKSNILALTDDLEGTKLLHYTNKTFFDSSVYDTYFSVMPKGYDLRLKSYFLQVENHSDDEVYQTYDGKYELVSSVPYSVVKLQIDNGGRGLPDWFVENLNFILKSSHKYIDGVKYQCTDNAEFDVANVDRYNNRFCTIELSRIDKYEYDISEFGGLSIYVDYIGDNKGKITIKGGIQDMVLSGGGGYSFSANITDGDSVVDFQTGINNSGVDKTTNIELVSVSDGRILGSFTLTNKAVSMGICYWEICDSFYVKC